VPIVLGSGSPRRRQLLEFLEIPHTIVTADIDERALKAARPREFALKAAYAKAMALDQLVSRDTIVITADTVVALDNKIYFKPDDAEDAFKMLRSLSGKEHQVITGVAVRDAGHATLLDAVTTRVIFKSLTDAQINAYVETGEPLDKAGSYGIQGHGGKLIERIEGDYFNVVGLPVDKLLEMLSNYCDITHFQGRRRELTPDIFRL